MLARTLLSAGVACAAAAATVAAGPVSRADAAPRACTPDDLQGARAPAQLRDRGLDTQSDPLLTGTRYRVVVVQELAIGDHAQPVDGSIAVGAPDGPPLQQTSSDERPAYDFTPMQAGKVRLVVTWEEEVGSPGSGDICAASQTFDLPVLKPTSATTKGRFSRGSSAFGSSFVLGLHGKAPQDPGKVSVIVRARGGTTKPPAAAGSALARFAFTPRGDGHFESSGGTRRLRHILYAQDTGSGVRIYPYVNIPFGRTLRFAFSIEATQHGRRVGGLRSGATCRRVQFRTHSAVLCRAVGLKQSP